MELKDDLEHEAENIKQKHCRVAINFEQELKNGEKSMNHVYELPDNDKTRIIVPESVCLQTTDCKTLNTGATSYAELSCVY